MAAQPVTWKKRILVPLWILRILAILFVLLVNVLLIVLLTDDDKAKEAFDDKGYKRPKIL